MVNENDFLRMFQSDDPERVYIAVSESIIISSAISDSEKIRMLRLLVEAYKQRR